MMKPKSPAQKFLRSRKVVEPPKKPTMSTVKGAMVKKPVETPILSKKTKKY